MFLIIYAIILKLNLLLKFKNRFKNRVILEIYTNLMKQ